MINVARANYLYIVPGILIRHTLLRAKIRDVKTRVYVARWQAGRPWQRQEVVRQILISWSGHNVSALRYRGSEWEGIIEQEYTVVPWCLGQASFCDHADFRREGKCGDRATIYQNKKRREIGPN